MPNAADMSIDDEASFLIVGDSGTKKTTFIGTCPSPIYIFDIDKGMAVHAGRSDIDYDTFKEMPKGKMLVKGGALEKAGWYNYGEAWPAILKKLNEIGSTIDNGTCKYKTIGIDSLTLLTDCALTYILKQNNRDMPEIRDWQTFLSNMSNTFGQLTGWPLVKVLTAHIKRDENQITGVIEQLPLVPGQFAGKVSVYFDEVYFTDVKSEPVKAGSPERKAIWTLRTTPDASIKQAKSRKYNVPTGTPTDFAAVAKHMAARRAAVVKP